MRTRTFLSLTTFALARVALAQTDVIEDPGPAALRDSVQRCLRTVERSRTGDPLRTVQLSLQAWSLAREHAPDLAQSCRLHLAQAYLTAGLPTKALEHVEGVLSYAADLPEALRLKADALDASGDHLEALKAWNRVMAVAKDDEGLLMHALKGAMRSSSLVNDRKSASRYGERLLELCHSRGEALNAGVCGNDLGHLASAEGKYEEAMAYYTRAAADLMGHPQRQLEAASNRATALIRLEHTAQALKDLEDISEQARAINAPALADRLRLLRSAAYLLDGRSMDALEEANAARTSAEMRNDTLVRIEAYDLLVYIHNRYGHFQEARVNAAQASALREQLRVYAELVHGARERSLAEAQRNEVQFLQRSEEQQRERQRLRLVRHEADERAQQAELVSIAADMRSAELQLAVEHAETERRLALARTALQYEQQVGTIQALEIARNKQALALAQSQHQQQAQQKKMELLTRDRALQAAEMEREIAQHRAGLWLLLLLLAVVLGAVVGLFLMRRKNRTIGAQVDEIERINMELRVKNVDLLSSITYAQRIQRAIVPTEEELKELLPDSFLFHKPRDIVSGDLPFVRREGERIFIATIDCTGHGVPAAMLSFMAYYNLNDIISARKSNDPGGILNELHERMQASMQSNTSAGTGDGMDITLVELDLQRRELHYSGANNALLLVRDGECNRLAGTKCSIGDPTGICAMGFNTQTLALRPSDRVYLYSDGFIHQFGGASGRKKFGSAQLMRTVAELGERPATELSACISAAQSNWQQQEPQTDDIVLIGFSIAHTEASRTAASQAA